MTIEKLPSGSYRIRQRYKGKLYLITLDHKPTQKEAVMLMAEKMETNNDGPKVKGNTVERCVEEYINDRENILSPGTIKGYMTIKRSMSSAFLSANIYDVTAADIQKEVNLYSKNHSAKSVRNFNGFISAVFSVYRPNMIFHTSLPQRPVVKRQRASEDDVQRILEASKNDKTYHVAFQLGVLGLRRGEIAALQLSDLKGNELTINKDITEDKNFHWVVKNIPKTEASNRTIIIPESLANEIRENGKIFDLTPPMLVQTLHKYQKELGIPEFRFHDLRSYCASYLHFLGYPDKYIQEFCGWSSSYTMNRIYKEVMEDKMKDAKLEMASSLLGK